LLYSITGRVVWESGELDRKEQVFHAQRSGVLDHGTYYAQKTQLDAHGKRILWAWIPERRSDDELRKAEWAGCMALPRELSLAADGDLEIRVAPVVQTLRGKKLIALSSNQPTAQRAAALREFKAESLCAELRWISTSAPFSMALADLAGPWWSLQVSRSGSNLQVQINSQTMEVPSSTRELRCHLLLDASVSEFFCNDLQVLTSRIYRKPEGPLRLEIPNSSLSTLRSLEAWQLRPISDDRLTT